MSDASAPENTTNAGSVSAPPAEPSAPPAAVIPEPPVDITATPPVPEVPAPDVAPPAPAPDVPPPPPPAPSPSPAPSSPATPQLVEDDAVAARLGQLESLMGDVLPQILHALKVASPSTPANFPNMAPPAESTHPTAVVPAEPLTTSNSKVGQLVSYSYHDNIDGDVTLMGIVVEVPEDPPDTCRVAWLGQLSGPLPAAHLTALD